MPIDYSKWDKIELSDDSDIEVHPNVDKKSFIKWKQRDIHEKRIERDNQIKGLRIQKEMYIQLNKRVDKLLATLTKAQIINDDERNKWVDDHFDPEEKCLLEENNDSPTYNEMIEDLFIQLKDDLQKEGTSPNDADALIKKIEEHRAKIQSVLTQIDPKLDTLLAEKAAHISSEDIHDGWNSSFINKNNGETSEKAVSSGTTSTSTSTASATKQPSSTIETINSPAVQSLSVQTPSKPLDQLDELEVLNETWEFSKISTDNFVQSSSYIENHIYIVSEQQKDALLMKAFDSQLDGDIGRAKQIVHQSMILQFLNDLLKAGGHSATLAQKKQAIGLFTSKLLDKSSAAYKAFQEEFKKTYDHIAMRCKVIAEEKEQNGDEDEYEGVEQIQLRSMDPNSELVITMPKENTPQYSAFLKLPEAMQSAIKTESLDEINKVFATMSVEEAEKVLETFDESGVISIQALLENEDEFEQLKEQLKIEEEEEEEGVEGDKDPSSNSHLELIDEDEDDVVVHKEDPQISTADIVD